MRGGLEVLHGVDLRVGDEVVAVFGLNGSGKSTLLRTISGLTPASGGSVRFAGEDLVGRTAHDVARRGIGFMPQSRQLFGDLSVYENLRLGAYLLSRRDVQHAVDATFDRFPRLAARRRVSANLLSGGERQLLALAKVLMLRPKMVMLDEPSAGLAPAAIDELYSVIRALRDDGLPVLMAEQNVRRALEISDRAMVLYLGNVVGGITLSEVQDPLAYVHGLMLPRSSAEGGSRTADDLAT